ncbi:MAG: hypothetical protein JWN30_2885 [Bacilli bacterium]|nr:hypothetical protein [Bacilli bacterium]
MKKWLTAMLAVFVLVGWFPTGAIYAAKTPVHTVQNTPLPKIVRVGIRENNWSGQPDPRGRIIAVQYYDFERYAKDVLPNEWSPSWNTDSLRAGAMAIKMFSWYHTLHPFTVQGQTFDVDNTVNFQVFRDLTDQPQTNTAVESVRGLAYVKRGTGEIVELNYRAGKEGSANWQYRNFQKMAQWGSQYLAENGYSYERILQFYYYNRDLARTRQ